VALGTDRRWRRLQPVNLFSAQAEFKRLETSLSRSGPATVAGLFRHCRLAYARRDGNRDPEVHETVGEYREDRLAVGHAETNEGPDQYTFDDAQSRRVTGIAAKMLARP